MGQVSFDVMNARVTFKNVPIYTLAKFSFKDVSAACQEFKKIPGVEECIIIQPDTVIEGAKVSAEKIRTVIEQNNFDKVKKITISVGVTMFKENDTADSITKRVDDALYRAKDNGRNRVEVA